MAKAPAVTGDIADWCDKGKVEMLFRRHIKATAPAGAQKDECTLSVLKRFLPKENYDEIQISFAGCARQKKYLPITTFVSKDFFLKMCKGKKEEKAKALATKLAALEDEEEAKEEAAKGKKKGDDVTSRLTDHSQYTGSHKERFDSKGQGKGISGRKDLAANDGYVGAYKNKDQYEKVKNTADKADDAPKRLTDASLYTGSHKERFDDSGKGKGKTGRVDEHEHTGYVGGYKGKGTYGKK